MSGTGIYPQFIHSKQVNVPKITGTVGSEGQLLQLLDAVLINGTGEQTPIDVAIDEEYIKFSYGTPHKYERLQFLQIEGANDETLNGRHRIIRTEKSSFWIEKGSISDVTGKILTKIATIGENGWENIFGNQDPLQRAYRSKNLKGTRTVLYLDGRINSTDRYDSTNPMKKYTFNACRDMKVLGEQIDSYTAYENDKYEDGTFHWVQAMKYLFYYQNTDNVRPWVLFGDGDIFYLCIGFNTQYDNERFRGVYVFGDLPKLSNTDQYNCIFSATTIRLPERASNEAFYTSGTKLGFNVFLDYHTGLNFIKDYSGVGGLEQAKKYCAITRSGAGAYMELTSRNPLTFGLNFADIFVSRDINKLGIGNFPYIKAIMNGLTDHERELDCKYFNDYFLFEAASSGDWDYNDQGYFAIDLMEQRLADNV